MVAKARTKACGKPKQQAHQTLQRSLAKSCQKSACTITNLASNTITPKPRTTYQCKHQTTGLVLRRAQWLLQLLQAKLSQEKVVHYFEATCQPPSTKLAEHQPPLKLAIKGPTKSFSKTHSTLK